MDKSFDIDISANTWICHSSVLDIYKLWLSIKKQPFNGPFSLDYIRQIRQPILISHTTKPRENDEIQFLSSFRWAMNPCNNIKTVILLPKKYADSGNIQPNCLSQITESAWHEVIALIHEDIDEDEGIFQWLNIVNSSVPASIVQSSLQVNTVTIEHLAQWRGKKAVSIKRKHLIYLSDLAKKHRPFSFNSMSDQNDRRP